MNAPEIVQDHEYDEEIGGPLAVFWAKGHDYDTRAFIRAVLDYCMDEDVDIPSITADDTPIQMWQRNVTRRDGVEYVRDVTPPESLRSSKFPITVLDLEGARRHGGTKCSISDCHEPWSVGRPVRVVVEPTDGGAEIGSPYMAAEMWLCRGHSRRMPEPNYRVCLVPVGAEILLPTSTDAAVAS